MESGNNREKFAGDVAQDNHAKQERFDYLLKTLRDKESFAGLQGDLRDEVRLVLEEKISSYSLIPAIDEIAWELKRQKNIDVSEEEKEGLFWKLLVCDAALPKIFERVSLIQNDEGPKAAHSELRKLLGRLSHALWESPDKRTEGLKKLGKEMERLYLELVWELDSDNPEYKEKAAKKSREQNEEQKEERRKRKTLDMLREKGLGAGLGKEFKENEALVHDPDRETPLLEDIGRDFLIEIEDFDRGTKDVYKVISQKPFDADDFPSVEAEKNSGKTGVVHLADIGVMPYFGNWYLPYRRPTRWGQGALTHAISRGGEKPPEAHRKPSWEIPEIGELQPGRLMEIINVGSGEKRAYEIAGVPQKDGDGFWRLPLFASGQKEPFDLRLDNVGLVPHPLSGIWNLSWRVRLGPKRPTNR